MSHPFLERFVTRVIDALLREEALEIQAGTRDAVVRDVATRLGTLGEGYSLISSLSKALLSCDAVEELYVDDQELKRIVGEMGSGWMRSVG